MPLCTSALRFRHCTTASAFSSSAADTFWFPVRSFPAALLYCVLDSVTHVRFAFLRFTVYRVLPPLKFPARLRTFYLLFSWIPVRSTFVWVHIRFVDFRGHRSDSPYLHSTTLPGLLYWISLESLDFLQILRFTALPLLPFTVTALDGYRSAGYYPTGLPAWSASLFTSTYRFDLFAFYHFVTVTDYGLPLFDAFCSVRSFVTVSLHSFELFYLLNFLPVFLLGISGWILFTHSVLLISTVPRCPFPPRAVLLQFIPSTTT